MKTQKYGGIMQEICLVFSIIRAMEGESLSSLITWPMPVPKESCKIGSDAETILFWGLWALLQYLDDRTQIHLLYQHHHQYWTFLSVTTWHLCCWPHSCMDWLCYNKTKVLWRGWFPYLGLSLHWPCIGVRDSLSNCSPCFWVSGYSVKNVLNRLCASSHFVIVAKTSIYLSFFVILQAIVLTNHSSGLQLWRTQ